MKFGWPWINLARGHHPAPHFAQMRIRNRNAWTQHVTWHWHQVKEPTRMPNLNNVLLHLVPPQLWASLQSWQFLVTVATPSTGHPQLCHNSSSGCTRTLPVGRLKDFTCQKGSFSHSVWAHELRKAREAPTKPRQAEPLWPPPTSPTWRQGPPSAALSR